MSLRASIFGVGAPGGTVDYEGDVPAPNRTYAASISDQAIHANLQIPASSLSDRSAVVQRRPRRNGHQFYYSHGGVTMQPPFPGPAGWGKVKSSLFQMVNVRLMDWMINRSWHEAGYPRNMGWSERTPQLPTDPASGPYGATQNVRPLFARVQKYPRSSAVVPTYNTQGLNG